jgi:hypothetical protein
MRFKNYKDKCPTDKALRKFLKTIGEDNLALCLDVINADNNSHSEAYNAPNQVSLILDRLKKLDVSEKPLHTIPINGTEIMNAFKLKPSPLVGKIIKFIEDAVLDNPNLTKEDCVSLIKFNFFPNDKE